MTVQLLQNGKVYNAITLSDQNSRRYSWNGLGPRSQWTVVERELPGYTVTVSQSGATFTVTNTASPEGPDIPETPKDPDIPKTPAPPRTGVLWWPVPLDDPIIAAHNYDPPFWQSEKHKHRGRSNVADMDGNVFSYTVFELEQPAPTAAEEMQAGDWTLTLFACTLGGQCRVAVRCISTEQSVSS